MSKHRFAPAALVIALAATLLPFTGPAEGAPSSSRDPGLLGAEATGTGVIPNFSAQGTNVIRLQVGAFDPLSDPLPSPAGIPLVDENTLPAGVAQYWLLQVRDNKFPQAADAVTAGGGLIAGYVQDDTYMVRATPAQRTAIAADPVVRWMGYYQPAWRVPVAAAGRPGLLQLAGTRTYEVHVFAEDPNPGTVAQALKGMSGVDLVTDAGVVVVVRATPAQIPTIAALPSVEWISIKPKAVLLNSNARWVNDTGVRDLYSATAPGRLNGAGQTAAVADTAVNYRYDLNHRAHVAFRDCDANGVCKEAIYTQKTPGNGEDQLNDVVNHDTNHRKMVAFFDIGNTGPNPFDDSSHGSHTGGSVDGDQPPYNQYTADDGLAPAAKHVHQNIGTNSGGLSTPEDLYDLFRQAYRPRDPASVPETSGPNGNPAEYTPEAKGGKYRPLEDARTHNNSWGLIVPLIDDTKADRLDSFVWNLEDFTISVSAGNGGPSVGSIGSPSTAKNELSSGASANGRQPMVSIDSMASFSSHGPTADGRYGPDLATPGQIVVSVKGGSTDGYHVAQGTSMSSPILTGLATLVRQYFFDGYAVAGGDGFAAGSPSAARSHNPSAALVKAALINGAVRMRGFYTGDEGSERADDGKWPSMGQGFGRVNLANSLYFQGDRTNNWYADVYRGDTTGDANFQSFSESAEPQTRTFQLKVAEGQPLDVTLAWTDAPNLAPAGTPALVNNLDLVVTGPGTGGGAMTYVGNNMNSRIDPSVDEAETVPGDGNRDVRNLTERVRLANPGAGTYTVTVEASPIAMGNQGFALAASGNIAPANGSFSPGPPLQVNKAGNPTVSNISVTPISSNTAKVRFQTSEPTTATADTTPAIPGETFVDSYNEGNDGFSGDLGEGPVETSQEYADKPVVGTQHEMLLTGFSAGQTYTIQLQVEDLANNTVTRNVTLKSPPSVFQAKSDDIGQCYQTDDPAPCQWDSGPVATQLYAGNIDGGALGAFMFRTPESLDPSKITMATVEMVSAHNWVVPYTENPRLYVDLLNEGEVEADWGTQNYEQIHDAQADARFYPETTHKRGAYYKYDFTLACTDLEKLKATLANDQAAFRWDSDDGGYFSMEFGFNRRSRGPDLRPKLVLYTDTTGTNPAGEACDPSTPAPKISNVGIHEGITNNSVTVSWETDVDSDSLVLFRKQGDTPWTQVGSPARTRVHHVEVLGLNRANEYEFAVRSAACNGATSTDTNAGKGYDFFRPLPPPPPPSTDYFFHGLATDQANKEASFTTGTHPPPGSLTFDTSNTFDPAPVTQSGAGANPEFIPNPLAVWWTGPYSGTIDRTFTFNWYWSTSNAEAVALGVDVNVKVVADPDFEDAGGEGNVAKVIGQTNTTFNFGAPNVPTLITTTVKVKGTISSEMLIQVAPVFTDTGAGLSAHYDHAATPSKFSIPNVDDPPAEEEELLPFTGPVPPPSAGAFGLSPPATASGEASAADKAAGTGYCDVPVQKPDLTATPDDVTASKPPRVGRTTKVTAVVHNVGAVDVSNVVVRFRLGKRILGKDQVVPSIPAGGTGTASVFWTPDSSGTKRVNVILDPKNQIAESNELNNRVRKVFTVTR